MNRNLLNRFAILAMVLLTVGATWQHGRMTYRWGTPLEMQAAGKSMLSFPKQFGDWKLLEAEELFPGILKEFQCDHYFHHTYLNVVSGEKVGVLLFLAPPGPLVRHPPEICYGGSNTLLGNPELVEFETSDGLQHKMRLLHYASASAIKPRFSVLFGYNSGTGWRVPDYPRTELGGEPLLYKLQVLSTESDNAKGTPLATSKFCQAFLPLFRRQVIAAEPTNSGEIGNR